MPSLTRAIAGITNAEFWDAARAASPKFKAHTSEATADQFTQKGFEALKFSDIDAINEYFEMSTRIVFQMLMVAKAKDLFEDSGIIETFDSPFGFYTQRQSMENISPINPQFLNLKDGQSVDQQVVFKSEQKERLFGRNFQFQAAITIPEGEMEQLYINSNGVGLFFAGKMKSLENAYIKQKSLNIKEILNAAINSTKWQLQDTQKIALSSWTDAAPSATELGDFILTIKNVFSDMEASEQTSAYNAGGFESAYQQDDHVIVMRAGIKNRIALELELGAYNPQTLSFGDTKIIEVKDFGGLVPYMLSGDDHVAQQPVYEKFGRVVGYLPLEGVTINGYATKRSDGKWIVNITSGGATADTTINEGKPDGWDDPNSNVLAIIIQKGAIVEDIQSAYQVSPAPRNAAGLYTTYWASMKNCGINIDPFYNFICIMKPEAGE